MKIKISSRFKKNYRKLSLKVKEKSEKREEIFMQNPFDPRLETHKLEGKYKEAWAYSVDRSYRIVFIFLDHETVLYLDIGTHDIYR